MGDFGEFSGRQDKSHLVGDFGHFGPGEARELVRYAFSVTVGGPWSLGGTDLGVLLQKLTSGRNYVHQ